MRKNVLMALAIIIGLFLTTYSLTTYASYYFIDGDIQELGQMLGAPTNSERYERNIFP